MKGTNCSPDGAKHFSPLPPGAPGPEFSGHVFNQEHFDLSRTELSIGAELVGKLSGLRKPGVDTNRSELILPSPACDYRFQRVGGLDCFLRRTCKKYQRRY